MTFQVAFSSRLPLPANQLPLTLISLEEWALVTLNGMDVFKYLQGQVTCDISTLGKNQHSFSAYCNAKGKIFSTMSIFQYQKGIALIQRRSVRNIQLAEMRKYAIFHKITICADDRAILLGMAGHGARECLSNLFAVFPDVDHSVVHVSDTTLIHFALPTERFLLVTNEEVRDWLVQVLVGQAQYNDSQQWLTLDIEAGYPIIDSKTILRFIPQETNLHALLAISFNKGCYIGQEVIARTKYRGTNKRALYWLVGEANRVPIPGDQLELLLLKNWRPTGTVLATSRLADGSIWVQAVLSNHLAEESRLRIIGDVSSSLKIHPLPYIIEA